MKNKRGEISNNILAILLVIAIVIGLIGFFIPKKIVGKVTDTGALQVTVSELTAINFTDDVINWGTGNVKEGYTYCEMDTEGNMGSGCEGFTNQNNGFTIENIGNVDVILQLATGKNADELIGGSNPLYQYKVVEAESGSCDGLYPSTYTNVNSTSPGDTICSAFYAEDRMDSVYIHVKVRIPSDAPPGTKSDTFTATATYVGG